MFSSECVVASDNLKKKANHQFHEQNWHFIETPNFFLRVNIGSEVIIKLNEVTSLPQIAKAITENRRKSQKKYFNEAP